MDLLIIILSLTTSFTLAFFSVPPIIRVAREKGFMDTPDHRKVHTQLIPRLGGIAIFAGTVIAMLLFVKPTDFLQLPYVVAAALVLFFIGLKDDILIIAPRKKFIGQFIAATIVVFPAKIRIDSLQGMFGIYNIPPWVAIVISLLFILATINAYNFIDGIDGLAASLGMLAALTYGTWFLLAGYLSYAVLGFALVGALAAFFRYNVFGKSCKIFMGDTGSMHTGFLLAVLTILFVRSNTDLDKPFTLMSTPAIAFAVLIVPLFDLMRIIFVRTFILRAFYTPDKNHIHHRLLRLRMSHKQASLTLLLVNVFFIAGAVIFRSLGPVTLLLVELLVAMGLSHLPSVFLGRQRKEHNKEPIDVRRTT